MEVLASIFWILVLLSSLYLIVLGVTRRGCLFLLLGLLALLVFLWVGTPSIVSSIPSGQPPVALRAPTPIPAAGTPVGFVVNPTATPMSATPAPQPTQPAPQTLSCTNGNEIPVPDNGQIFMATTWVNQQPVESSDYAIVFDPNQSGVTYIDAQGWWYQPCLPGPHREYHEVAIVLQAGTYKFVGPECTVWHNPDGNRGGRDGNLLVQRQNVEFLNVAATSGAPDGESWVFVQCQKSDASGFSFALRDSR
jgi:hypothetical protein